MRLTQRNPNRFRSVDFRPKQLPKQLTVISVVTGSVRVSITPFTSFEIDFILPPRCSNTIV